MNGGGCKLTFAEYLRDKRKANGLTQKQAAQASGMSETQYQAYEQGRIVPKFETAYRLAHALRFSLDECATTIFVVVSQE
mgnify:FL=1